MDTAAEGVEDGVKVSSKPRYVALRQLPEEETNPPIDYTKNLSTFSGARFVLECGVKLKASVLTTATAATYYHKFYQLATKDEYDPYFIGCVCLYLASKVEDDDIKIRDIINVGIGCVRRGEPPLSLDPYFCVRDALIQGELLLMRFLGFRMKVDLPHKYLLHYVESLKEWLGAEVFETVPMIQLAWTLVQDIYHHPLVLKYSPQLVSAAILNVAVQVYGIIVPGCDEIDDRSWFTVLHPDCTTKAVWELTTRVMAMYKADDQLILAI